MKNGTVKLYAHLGNSMNNRKLRVCCYRDSCELSGCGCHQCLVLNILQSRVIRSGASIVSCVVDRAERVSDNSLINCCIMQLSNPFDDDDDMANRGKGSEISYLSGRSSS